MSFALDCYLLSPSLRSALARGGFVKDTDLTGFTPLQLADELSITAADAKCILDVVCSKNNENVAPNANASTSALTRFALCRRAPKIFTMSPAIDRILGGGIATAAVTEVCGKPGVGKTQFAMQIAVAAHIPKRFSGLAGESIVVDTEGSVSAARIQSMAQALVAHVSALPAPVAAAAASTAALAVDDILKGIHVVRVFDAAEQCAVTDALADFITRRPLVRVVVVDSIAFHFRRSAESSSQRHALLMRHCAALHQLAQRFDVAVVAVNQMTTKLYGDGDHRATVAPALGESFAHFATTRLQLEWNGATRTAAVIKSNATKHDKCAFDVVSAGIRDVTTTDAQTNSAPSNIHKRRFNET